MVVIVAVMLVALLGMVALAIDLGSFFQQQRQAQSAVDAAALAGAQELPASPGTATTQAQSYLDQNLPGGTSTIVTPYNSTSSQIKVTVSENVPSTFGTILGLSSANVSASAVAGLKGVPSCSAPGTSCYAIFAKDPVCTSGHNSITITGGNINIGAILTNGSLSTTGGNDTFGATTIGPSASVPPCKWTDNGGSKTFGGNPAPTAGAGTSGWPIDYSYDFPPCTTTCTGPLGTPSFCTQASTAASYSVAPAVNSPQIYCGVGSGNVKDPTTWTGAMSVTTAAGGSAGSPQEDTYVAGSVSFPSATGGYLEPCGYASSGYVAAGCPAGVPSPPYTANYPLVYAVAAGAAVTVPNAGGTSFIGDVFAPNGTISFTGGGLTTGFLEGWDVTFQGGNFT
ncbi:MAG: pilus assembly protein TadG-related protein, partial [Candidatus Dormibacteraeota bacterium]|nr:pilus assembly protein TadG-related protein [Candidatus Dormibacteraeota bacterium]